MTSYVIKQGAKIERQKNDHFDIVIVLDPHFDINNMYRLGLYSNTGKHIVSKDAAVNVEERKLTFTFVPSDTETVYNVVNGWELQMKTAGGQYYTIGSGEIYLYQTYVVNE